MCPHSENGLDVSEILNTENVLNMHSPEYNWERTRYLIILRTNNIKNKQFISKLSWLDRTAVRSNIFSKNKWISWDLDVVSDVMQV